MSAHHPHWVIAPMAECASVHPLRMMFAPPYVACLLPISSAEGVPMSTLIAIGYPDEATATAAGDEAQRLARDLVIEPDAIAVIRRDREGKFHVTTNHHTVGGGATWGMFWGFLFGLLFFVPVFGMAVGAGLGALMGKVEKTGIDKGFQEQVRDMMQPGTSALFLVVEQATPDKAVEALSKFGGTVLKSNLTKKAEAELQQELHGAPANA